MLIESKPSWSKRLFMSCVNRGWPPFLAPDYKFSISFSSVTLKAWGPRLQMASLHALVHMVHFICLASQSCHICL